jgi:hypothetical protein
MREHNDDDGGMFAGFMMDGPTMRLIEQSKKATVELARLAKETLAWWMVKSTCLDAGRKCIMRALGNPNSKKHPALVKGMADFLRESGLDKIPSEYRTDMQHLVDNWDLVKPWWDALPEHRRNAWNNPRTVWSHYKDTITDKPTRTEPTPKETIVRLKGELKTANKKIGELEEAGPPVTPWTVRRVDDKLGPVPASNRYFATEEAAEAVARIIPKKGGEHIEIIHGDLDGTFNRDAYYRDRSGEYIVPPTTDDFAWDRQSELNTARAAATHEANRANVAEEKLVAVQERNAPQVSVADGETPGAAPKTVWVLHVHGENAKEVWRGYPTETAASDALAHWASREWDDCTDSLGEKPGDPAAMLTRVTKHLDASYEIVEVEVVGAAEESPTPAEEAPPIEDVAPGEDKVAEVAEDTAPQPTEVREQAPAAPWWQNASADRVVDRHVGRVRAGAPAMTTSAHLLADGIDDAAARDRFDRQITKGLKPGGPFAQHMGTVYLAKTRGRPPKQQ